MWAGKMQRISHVDSYIVTRNRKDEIPFWDDEDLYVFRLGTPIFPTKETKSGIRYNARVWADIDLLLTCDTIKEASDKSKDRKK